MAVYEGARPRPTFFPGRGVSARGVEAPALPRRRARAATRAHRRSGRIGIILGGIVLAFLLGFFSLAQTVRVSASGYDIGRLQEDRVRLAAQQQQLLSDLNRLGREPAIRKQAIDLGLGQLAEPLVLTPR